MSKRANGEGSIFKRSDGRWCATVSVDGGRRKSFYGQTRQEVAKKLAAALKARQDGLPLPAERQTVGQFLVDWLKSAKQSLRPLTHKRYGELIRLHALPSIGRVAVSKLSPQHLERLYADRLDAGLSPATVRQLHAVLRRALGQALKWGSVGRNVATLVTPPRVTRHEITALTKEEVRALLVAARGDAFEALYVLAVTTGMRQGELLALRWQDIDQDFGSLRIRGSLQRTSSGFQIVEPKSISSRRRVTVSTTAMDALRRHRAGHLERRLRIGRAWHDQDLVFPNAIGRPLESSNLLRQSFLPLLERAGLRRIRFHDLRHTAATLMLGQGVHPKIVAEMLGHSRIGTTLDLYSHVTPTMQRGAAAEMDAILQA